MNALWLPEDSRSVRFGDEDYATAGCFNEEIFCQNWAELSCASLDNTADDVTSSIFSETSKIETNEMKVFRNNYFGQQLKPAAAAVNSNSNSNNNINNNKNNNNNNNNNSNSDNRMAVDYLNKSSSRSINNIKKSTQQVAQMMLPASPSLDSPSIVIRSKVASFENIHHKPGGGNVHIYSKRLDFSHVQSKCDSRRSLQTINQNQSRMSLISSRSENSTKASEPKSVKSSINQSVEMKLKNQKLSLNSKSVEGHVRIFSEKLPWLQYNSPNLPKEEKLRIQKRVKDKNSSSVIQLNKRPNSPAVIKKRNQHSVFDSKNFVYDNNNEPPPPLAALVVEQKKSHEKQKFHQNDQHIYVTLSEGGDHLVIKKRVSNNNNNNNPPTLKTINRTDYDNESPPSMNEVSSPITPKVQKQHRPLQRVTADGLNSLLPNLNSLLHIPNPPAKVYSSYGAYNYQDSHHPKTIVENQKKQNLTKSFGHDQFIDDSHLEDFFDSGNYSNPEGLESSSSDNGVGHKHNNNHNEIPVLLTKNNNRKKQPTKKTNNNPLVIQWEKDKFTRYSSSHYEMATNQQNNPQIKRNYK